MACPRKFRPTPRGPCSSLGNYELSQCNTSFWVKLERWQPILAPTLETVVAFFDGPISCGLLSGEVKFPLKVFTRHFI